MEKIYVNNEEELILGLIKDGKEEADAVAVIEKLDEEIELGFNTLVAKVGDTYITREGNLEALKELYGVEFIPIRVE